MGNGDCNGYLFRISDRLEVFANEPEANVLLAVLAAQKFLRVTRDEMRSGAIGLLCRGGHNVRSGERRVSSTRRASGMRGISGRQIQVLEW